MASAPVSVLGAFADEVLFRQLDEPSASQRVQSWLYAALRREQAVLVAAASVNCAESARILGHAQGAYRDLHALVAGRGTGIVDLARDGDWTLRDLLRHAIAVELRYCEQVLYSATRSDDEPVRIPDERLPCDRLSPPEPEFADTRTADAPRILDLFGVARRRTDERLADLAESSLERPSLWGTYSTDVRERLHQIGVHVVEVTLQTEKMLYNAGVTDGEARRILRCVWRTRGLHERTSTGAQLADLDQHFDELARLARRPEP
jgi:hypothetical protein